MECPCKFTDTSSQAQDASRKRSLALLQQRGQTPSFRVRRANG